MTHHPLLVLLYHLNDSALFARVLMGLDLHRAHIGTNAATFAVIVVKLSPAAILDDNRGIRAIDPADQTMGAFLHVMHWALNTPGAGVVFGGASRLENQAGDIHLFPGSVFLRHVASSLSYFFVGSTQGRHVALHHFGTQLGP